jgi:hypothetical protein
LLRICFVAVYAAVSVPALACRADAPETRAPTTTPPTTSVETVVTKPASDSLRLELLLPRSVRAGEPVSISLRVENRTRHAIDLYLRGRTATFDVIVSRPDGVVVWQRLEDEIIPAIVGLRALAPGERLELATVWNQQTKQRKPVGPGEYTARGLLLVEGKPLEAPPLTFAIVER